MEYRFGELFSWASGKPITPIGGDIPVYGANGVVGYSTVAKYTNRIILGRVGAYCGSVAYCRGPFNATDNTLITECDENKITYQYAYNLLKHFNLNSYAGGAAQPLITQTILKHLKSDIPPLPTQRKIAKVLSAYDDLIENNTKRIGILERMAEELYKEWFVRFRFPGHEKAKFVNGLPEGWKREYVVETFCFARGAALTKDEVFSNPTEEYKYPVYGAGRGIFGYFNKANACERVVIVAAIGESAGYVRRSHEDLSFVTSNSYIVKTKSRGEFPFMWHCLKNVDFSLYVGGSAQPMLSGRAISKAKCVVPDKEHVELFCRRCMSFEDEVDTLYSQNALLARQRDLLLPRLMSGKLSVEGVG